MKKVYSFVEGDKSMKDLLGGKGANLAEMVRMGLPVPAGFTVTTQACGDFLELGDFDAALVEEIEAAISFLENESEKSLGSKEKPLLVSVRSGAAISMPGMMDTILNLGLNDETVEALSAQTNNPRFAYDSYRRFIQMFSSVVLDLDHEEFEHSLTQMKAEKSVIQDTDLTAEDLKNLVKIYKSIVEQKTKNPFPQDPRVQLFKAIEAVFRSWNNDRAIFYRRIHNVTGLKGTAVNVQAMVFGNMGETSGTGVTFTRNPSTGEKTLYGEFLLNAQGEDVVAGIRTPMPISSMEQTLSEAYKQLTQVAQQLENHYGNMQDIEFTVENKKLFILQTRNGKATAQAALRIAVDMVEEGLCDRREALKQIDPQQLTHLLHPQFADNQERKTLTKGLPASPGAACGRVVFSSEDAIFWSEEKDEKVILVRTETTPEDIHGMHSSEGILTSTGGMTSHAAVVARGMGKCCIVGANEVVIDKKARKALIGGVEICEGDIISLDGTSGEVLRSEMQMVEPKLSQEFHTVMEWADSFRKLQIRANADNSTDAQIALDFGAEGIGLCRTEHMFFAEDRIAAVREMILASNLEGRMKALSKLLPMQRSDFLEIFKTMNQKPVTIRLLDPPLHEFLPDSDKKIEKLAEEMGISFKILKDKVISLHEVNPMLGHRGCRLGITYPEIYEMQVQAIIEAAIEAANQGFNPIPEIEVPLVGDCKELKKVRHLIESVRDKYGKLNFPIKIGTMIELPRACLTADEIAKSADFFSFGTNDLTQTTFGFSRDDIGKFLPFYLQQGLLEVDPAVSLDTNGVGKLMQMAVAAAKNSDHEIEIGICGEHGGDPKSIHFCHQLQMDYVSCSPYRVAVARLAAAQAAL